MNSGYSKVQVSYDAKNMDIYINAPSTAFIKNYVKYLLEYLEVSPENDIHFSDGVTWNLVKDGTVKLRGN